MGIPLGSWGGTEVIKSLGHKWAFCSSAVVINLSGISTKVFWCILNSCTSIVVLYIVPEHYFFGTLYIYKFDNILD